MSQKDKAIDNLLELNGVRYVIEEHLGLWVKFEARRVDKTDDRPHGIRYALTLHNRFNERIMGFDNAHPIPWGKKTKAASKQTHDHWHRDESDSGRPYSYENAGKLIEDFWQAVERVLDNMRSE